MAYNFELDHTYLQQAIGAPLTEAMAQLAILQPEDPVEFLGNYLLKYVANVETQQQLQKRKETQQQGVEMPNKVNDQQQEQELEWEEEQNQVQLQLHNAPSMALLFHRFLEWLCLTLNAEEAYLGRKCVDLQGNNVVHFVASSKHLNSTVVDKFVTQLTHEGKNDSAHYGGGVTFDVFEEIQPLDDTESPTVDDKGNPLPATSFKVVLVENVLREPRVKFFGVPKLGALLMRAGHYNSYLHADVLNESNPEEPHVLKQWLVFAIDTMGQARTFTKKEMDRFHHATNRFLATLEEKEREMYMKDNEQRISSNESLLHEFLVAFAAQVAVQEENLTSQLPAPSEGEELSEAAQQQRAAKETELRLFYLTTLLKSHIPTLSLASTRAVPFKTLVLSTFATALELLGYSRRELFNPATGQPSWDKISPLLRETALEASLSTFEASLTAVEALLEANDATAKSFEAIRKALPVTPGTIAHSKQTLAEISKKDVDSASPVASCFYMWALAVIARAEILTIMADRAQMLEDEAAAVAAASARNDDT